MTSATVGINKRMDSMEYFKLFSGGGGGEVEKSLLILIIRDRIFIGIEKKQILWPLKIKNFKNKTRFGRGGVQKCYFAFFFVVAIFGFFFIILFLDF